MNTGGATVQGVYTAWMRQRREERVARDLPMANMRRQRARGCEDASDARVDEASDDVGVERDDLELLTAGIDVARDDVDFALQPLATDPSPREIAERPVRAGDGVVDASAQDETVDVAALARPRVAIAEAEAAGAVRRVG